MLREGSKEMDTERLCDLVRDRQRDRSTCDSFLDLRIEVLVTRVCSRAVCGEAEQNSIEVAVSVEVF